ncbi:hypothetical protein [Streptomyces sp. NPDC059224]|uniref:hypothetical protein n=1 Tax=Streptomyces sp. NPDC059224 TaxID=3346775 RepID=UPI003687422E
MTVAPCRRVSTWARNGQAGAPERGFLGSAARWLVALVAKGCRSASQDLDEPGAGRRGALADAAAQVVEDLGAVRRRTVAAVGVRHAEARDAEVCVSVDVAWAKPSAVPVAAPSFRTGSWG